MAIGDWNGDRRMDIAVVAFHRQFRRWDWTFYWNDGGLRFSVTRATDLPPPPRHLRAVDVDADGADEIAGALENELLLVSAHPARATARVSVVSLLRPHARIEGVADVDNDGWSDLLFEASSGVGVIWGSAAGHNEMSVASVPRAGQIFAGRFDDDIHMDFGTEQAILYGDGTRRLAAPAMYASILDGRDLFFADVDEDGDQDAVVASGGFAEIEVLYRTPAGFRHGPRMMFGASIADRVRAVGDFDGDGHADIAASIGAPPSGAIYFDINSEAKSKVDIAVDAIVGAATRLPGEPPVLVVSYHGTIEILQITRTRTVERETVWKGAATQVSIVDTDFDGDSDLLIASGVDRWLLENRAGAWSHALSLTGLFQGSVHLDVDGDGDLDLIGWVGTQYTVYWREVSGFREAFFGHAPGSVAHIHASDWDGDSRTDIILVLEPNSSRESFVQLLRNVGGAFEPVAATVVRDFRAPGRQVDVDEDGWQDLVVLTGVGIEVLSNVCDQERVNLTTIPRSPLSGGQFKVVAMAAPAMWPFHGKLTLESPPGVMCQPADLPISGVLDCQAGLSPGRYRFVAKYDDQLSGSDSAALDIVVSPAYQAGGVPCSRSVRWLGVCSCW